MKVIGIIPARYGSTRFPGKPLAMINGKTMIQRVYEQATQAIKEVWIATDDQRIMDEVASWGGCAVMTSVEHQSGTSRCLEVAERLKLKDKDIVINIQGDEPFIEPEHIKVLIDCFNDGMDIITLIGYEATEEYKNPNCVKVVTNIYDFATHFSRKQIKGYTNYKHIGIYGYRVRALQEIAKLKPSKDNLEQMAWLEREWKIKCVQVPYDRISIDTPDDLIRAEQYLIKQEVERIFDAEATAIFEIPIGKEYWEAVGLIYRHVHYYTNGKLVTSGIGKAGQVAHDIATTFSSTGTPAVFLHPAEAQHGDLGLLQADDILLIISNSGETRELIELLELANDLNVDIPVILITGAKESSLWFMADVKLWTGAPKEVCPLGLTPTTSTTVMGVIGDALVTLMMQKIGFTREEYAKRHHGGYIGKQLKQE